MFIYLIQRTDKNIGYDEWDSFVVAAHDPIEAMKFVMEGPIEPRPGSGNIYEKGIYGNWGYPIEIGLAHPEYIVPGTAYIERVDAIKDAKPVVILGSWNAG